VIRGGVLKDNKGMNLPDTKLSISALTAKDRNDVPYCIRADVDYLALSFVRRPSDVLELKEYLKELNADIPIIAKIEKPEALSNISEILNVSDGIMVARGDLGVEMPARKVPLIQNELIKRASQFNKPVIVATQMLESMIENAKPTRAEVTDVAFACMNGADAVMLSAETAAGKYPVEAVEMMDAILREVEAYQWAHGRFSLKSVNIKREELQNAIGIATSQLSRDLKTRCIAVLTRSGKTARIVSSDKPASPVFALSGSEKVVRQLNLMWGVVPFHIRKELKFSEYVKEAEKLTKQKKIAKKGDYILILSGMSDKSGETNSIVVHRIS
jgi:pyruvate kinase